MSCEGLLDLVHLDPPRVVTGPPEQAVDEHLHGRDNNAELRPRRCLVERKVKKLELSLDEILKNSFLLAEKVKD